MTDTPNLRPAARDEVIDSLSFALQFHGKKRMHSADSMMARITAERLVEHLRISGYVVMQKPPSGHGAAGDPTAWAARGDEPDRIE